MIRPLGSLLGVCAYSPSSNRADFRGVPKLDRIPFPAMADTILFASALFRLGAGILSIYLACCEGGDFDPPPDGLGYAGCAIRGQGASGRAGFIGRNPELPYGGRSTPLDTGLEFEHRIRQIGLLFLSFIVARPSETQWM